MIIAENKRNHRDLSPLTTSLWNNWRFAPVAMKTEQLSIQEQQCKNERTDKNPK